MCHFLIGQKRCFIPPVIFGWGIPEVDAQSRMNLRSVFVDVKVSTSIYVKELEFQQGTTTSKNIVTTRHEANNFYEFSYAYIT